MRLTLMGKLCIGLGGRFHINLGERILGEARTGMESSMLVEARLRTHATLAGRLFGVWYHGFFFTRWSLLSLRVYFFWIFSVFWRLGCRPRAEYHQFCPSS